jgi:hypothetical protein
VVHNILVGPVCIISDAADLIQAIIGLIAGERFDISGQTSLGQVNEFEKAVYRATLVFGDLELLANIKYYHRGLFDQAITKLVPVLLIDQTSDIHFLHPGFMGILAYLNRCDLITNSSLLLDLIKISRYRRQEARFSSEAENLQKEGIKKISILNCINKINDIINYSRILKR